MPTLIIGNAPREIRGISLKGGRTGTGSCQIQNPFDRQTYRAESFYSFHPWLVPYCMEKLFQLPSSSQSPQRGIFTNISQLKTSCSHNSMLSILSRASADSRFSSFLLFPRYSKTYYHSDSRITGNAPPRKFDRESSLSASRGSTFHSFCAYFTFCFIHLWGCSSSIKRNFFV